MHKRNTKLAGAMSRFSMAPIGHLPSLPENHARSSVTHCVQLREISGIMIWLVFLLFGQTSYAQKKLLQLADYKKWPHVENKEISDDGKFAMYNIQSYEGSELILTSTDQTWTKKLSGYSGVKFLNDSRFAICSLNDTICVVELSTDRVSWLDNVELYKMPSGKNDTWIGYKRRDKQSQLIILNLKTFEKKTYDSVLDFFFSDNGPLVIEKALKADPNSFYDLYNVNLENGSESKLTRCNGKVVNLKFDSSATQIAYIIEQSSDSKKTKSLVYFNMFSKRSIVVDSMNGSNGESIIAGDNYDFPQFSKTGQYIFFKVKGLGSKMDSSPTIKSDNPVVWDYSAPSLRKIPNNNGESHLAVLNLVNGNSFQLEGKNDELLGTLSNYSNNFVLINHSKGGEPFEYNWNDYSLRGLYLVNIDDGIHTLISNNIVPLDLDIINVSPDGKYVTYYDLSKGSYMCYNIKNKTTINLRIPTSSGYPLNDSHRYYRPYGIAAWSKVDNFVLFYDEFDIWKVYPDGNLSPRNITGSFGRKNNIALRIAPVYDNSSNAITTVNDTDTLLLVAFSNSTKYNGFFKVALSDPGAIMQLTMGPYIYYYPRSSYTIHSRPPVKAKNSNAYILERQSCSDAPNIYFTKDFVNFNALSRICPSNDYRWMKTELIKWTTLDGKNAEGLLYKPEDFDPQKKYPIIFYFYEKDPDALNNFIYPQLSNGELDITFFVSHDYLVFYPSIYYKIGQPGQSAYNSVVSAALYLSKEKWIDNTRMGLQGMSFGGYEVNYLITRTGLFAAAAESAGTADLISGYGSFSESSGSLQFKYETGQYRIGASIWQNPKLFIDNSPILHLNKVKTPLLIMHNKEDKQVPWQQAMELFTGLRRLNKKAWLLEYAGEGHSLSRSSKNQVDYSQKLLQFFDYYLKRQRAPELDGWRTRVNCF